MTGPLFYVQDLSAQGENVRLPRDEAHHAQGVLRLKPDDPVVLVNGEGSAYQGVIVRIAKGVVEVLRQECVRGYGESSMHVTLAAGLSKGEKFDRLVQQGTEIGVSSFVPIITEKSQVRLASKEVWQSRLKRLQHVAVAAMKQARRSVCPSISLPIDFQQCIIGQSDGALKIIFHLGAESSLSDNISGSNDAVSRVVLLVGPESGFTHREVELARAHGWRACRFGHSVLRTETAGPVLAAVLLSHLGGQLQNPA